MNKPKVSVIIPAFNEEKYVTRCLKAVTMQKTRFPYEVILVNNASTDKTAQIAKRYTVRIINERRPGRAYARQSGANASRGDILAFTEADCIPPVNWIETIGEKFQKYPDSVAILGSWRLTNTTSSLSLATSTVVPLSNYLYRMFFGNHTLRGTNFAIRKKLLMDVGPFHQEAVPFDDFEYGLRIKNYGRVLYLPELKVATSDRRLRGRISSYLWEFVSSFTKIFILKELGHDNMFEPIR